MVALCNLYQDYLSAFELFAQMSHYSEQGSSVAVWNRCLMLPQLFPLFLWSANRIVLFVDFLCDRPSHLIARNIVNIRSFTFTQDNVPNFCQCTSTCSTKAGRKRTGCPRKTAGRYWGEACSCSRRKPCKNREVGKQSSVEV